MIAVFFVSVNTDLPDQDISNWKKIAQRSTIPLPRDNNLQYRTAQVFIKSEAPWAEKYWTMGDRPPLMGIINSVWALTTLNKNYTFWNYQLVGIILNILFILPCTIISKKIFKSPKVFNLIPLAILLNVFIFTNIYFTWPKLLGVYFILVSIALLLKKRMELLSMSIAGMLWGMASLSHGGAILSLPVLLLLCLILSIRIKKMKYLIPFAACFLFLQSPWIIYKKNHPTIDTNQLIYHYVPTEKIPGNSLKTYSHFIEEYPLKKQIHHRIQNIRYLFQKNSLPKALKALFSGNLNKYYKNLDLREFFYPVVAMGEFQILLCVPIIVYFLASYFLSHQKKVLRLIDFKLLFFFFTFILLSYSLNVFIKWKEIINHALPYTELIFGIALFAGISFSLSKIVRSLSLSLIFIRFLKYGIDSSLCHNFPLFDFHNILFFIGIFILLYMAKFYTSKG